MIIPDFEKLFTPYTADGATLENTRAWLVKKAQRLGIAEQIADQAIAETMLEMAGGKMFSHQCPCCSSAEAHNTLEHYMRDRMIALHQGGMQRMIDYLQGSIRYAILAHIQRENAEFVRRHMRPGIFQRLAGWLRGEQDADKS
jgi:hypothetical protein